MNWELVGILADVVGAGAVVASLVYLARQIALSNKLARAEAYRQPNSDLTSLNATFTTIPVFNLALRRVFRGASRAEFNEEERAVLDAYMVSVSNLFEQLAREIREGILDADAFENFGGYGLIITQYYRTSWALYKNAGAMGKKFQNQLEELFDLDSSIEAEV